MNPIRPLVIGPKERMVLAWLALIALAVGLVGGAVLAMEFDGNVTVPKSYWDTLLTITGVSALPLVAAVVLVVRARLNEDSKTPGYWGIQIAIVGGIAFAISLIVILICVYYATITGAAEGETPMRSIDPGDFWVWVATVGAGSALAAVAVSVSAAALNTIDEPAATPPKAPPDN